MNEESELTNVLLGAFAMQEITKDYAVKKFKPFDSWVAEVKYIYNDTWCQLMKRT